MKVKYGLPCYDKQSPLDVPLMKGDRGPRLKHTYKRYDKDLDTVDIRESGSLPLKRRDTKCGTLARTYREFIKEVLNQGLYFHIEGWSSGGVSLPTHSGITAAHTEKDIAITLEKIQQIFKKLSKERI